MEIRSYRRVFDLERRVYRIDRLRLNPAGIPLRGIVYFLALLAAGFLLARLPLLGLLAGALPWYVRDLVLPGAIATLLGAVRVDGRPFHLAARALVRNRTAPARAVGAVGAKPLPARWAPEDIVLLPDGSESELRALRYTGPGAVRVAVEHDLSAVRGARAGLLRFWRAAPALSVSARLGARPLKRAQLIVLDREAVVLLERAPAGGD